MSRNRSTQRVSLELDGKSGTDQTARVSSDVNNMVAQYLRNGTLPALSAHDGLYGDFTGPQDLQDQMEAVYQAEERFQLLPGAVRKAADNSPVKFLEMLDDPTRAGELVAAGLFITDDEGNLIDIPVSVETEAAPAADDAPEGASDTDG